MSDKNKPSFTGKLTFPKSFTPFVNGIVKGMKFPDSTIVTIADYPLSKEHWLYVERPTTPPMPFKMGVSDLRTNLATLINTVGKYALKVSIMDPSEVGFDPDAYLANLTIGFLGYWTETGDLDAKIIPSLQKNFIQEIMGEYKTLDVTNNAATSFNELAEFILFTTGLEVHHFAGEVEGMHAMTTKGKNGKFITDHYDDLAPLGWDYLEAFCKK